MKTRRGMRKMLAMALALAVMLPMSALASDTQTTELGDVRVNSEEIANNSSASTDFGQDALKKNNSETIEVANADGTADPMSIYPTYEELTQYQALSGVTSVRAFSTLTGDPQADDADLTDDSSVSQTGQDAGADGDDTGMGIAAATQIMTADMPAQVSNMAVAAAPLAFQASDFKFSPGPTFSDTPANTPINFDVVYRPAIPADSLATENVWVSFENDTEKLIKGTFGATDAAGNETASVSCVPSVVGTTKIVVRVEDPAAPGTYKTVLTSDSFKVLPSTPPAFEVKADPATQEAGLGVSITSAMTGGGVTKTPTGEVTYTVSDANNANVVTKTVGFTDTYVFATDTPGDYSVVAKYLGDDTDYAASALTPSISFKITERKTATDMIVDTDATDNEIELGKTVVITAAIAPDIIDIDESMIVFYINNQRYEGTVTISDNTAFISYTPAEEGVYNVTVQYGPSVSSSIRKEIAVTVTHDDPAPVKPLPGLSVTATLQTNGQYLVTATTSVPGSPTTPTGVITFSVPTGNGTLSVTSVTLDATGKASTLLTLATGATGTVRVIATYAETAQYAADSVEAAIELPKDILNTRLVLNVAQEYGTVYMSAAVTNIGRGAVPTGEIIFMSSDRVIGVARLDAYGAAYFEWRYAPTGWHLLTAVYQGDATHKTSRDTLNFNILEITPEITETKTPKSNVRLLGPFGVVMEQFETTVNDSGYGVVSIDVRAERTEYAFEFSVSELTKYAEKYPQGYYEITAGSELGVDVPFAVLDGMRGLDEYLKTKKISKNGLQLMLVFERESSADLQALLPDGSELVSPVWRISFVLYNKDRVAVGYTPENLTIPVVLRFAASSAETGATGVIYSPLQDSFEEVKTGTKGYELIIAVDRDGDYALVLKQAEGMG